MIHTVNISNIEEIMVPYLNKSKTVKIFYPLFDFEYLHADYTAVIKVEDGLIVYHFGGHGIGESKKQFKNYSDLLDNVIKDNELLNVQIWRRCSHRRCRSH